MKGALAMKYWKIVYYDIDSCQRVGESEVLYKNKDDAIKKALGVERDHPTIYYTVQSVETKEELL